MEETLWIEGTIESTQAPPFFINSRIDMASFVDPHKVIVTSAFLALPSAQIGGESIGGVESGRLKHQFSQVEGDLDLQEIPKFVSITKNRAPKKQAVVVKDEDEKVEKKLVDGEVLHLIILKGKMELEFAKNAKNKVNFVFILEVFSTLKP
jgi:hypothetical protein